jgi:D-alanyl-D-alanine carboxypeptidase
VVDAVARNSCESLQRETAAPMNTESADPVDEFITQKMQEHHIPGAAVGVLRGGELIKVNAYGLANVEWSVPATTGTVFALASTTKPFTGTAISMLLEEGNFSLDDRVTELLPELPPAWRDVTVRHCCSHTSGLPDLLRLEPGTTTPSDTREELIRRLADLPVEFPPGERISYNQTCYLLAQMLIEKISESSYESFMSQRIFQPLGMSNTQFRSSYAITESVGRYFSTIVHNRVGLYARENISLLNLDYLYGSSVLLAAAGLNSSGTDLARFDAALYTEKLMTAASLEQMWAPTRLNRGDPAGYGLGRNIDAYRGHRYVGHQGGMALSNFARHLDDRLTIILLTNLDSHNTDLAEGIARLYLPATEETVPAQPSDG